MANCKFFHTDKTLSASSITGGSWTAGLPLTNLKIRDITRVARSTNCVVTNTKFFITLAASAVVQSVILYNVNFSASARIRIGTFSSADWGNVTATTGWLDAFSGGVSTDVLSGYNNHAYVLPSFASSSIIGIEIDDTTNSAGYVQLGRAMCCDVYTPESNMSIGVTLGEDDTTESERTKGGKVYFDNATLLRIANLKFENHTDTAALAFKALQRKIGRSGEVFFAFDSDDSGNLRQQRSFLAYFTALSSIEYAINNLTGYAVGLLEIV